MTNSLTQWIAGLVLGLGALLAVPTNVAWAQERDPEPVVEPVGEHGPVIETSGDEQSSGDQTVAAAGEPVVVEPARDDQSSRDSSSAKPVVDPPSRVARLGYVEGEVTVAPAGTEDWAEAALNRPLTSGDRLWVDNGGRAELQIGSSAVYLDGETGFGFIELDDGVMQASLTEGAATVRVRRLAEGETIQIETPHSTVVLKKVGEYHLEVDKSADRTIVKTRNGLAEVSGDNQRYTVRDNERGIFAGTDKMSGHIEPLGPRTAFENWANDRDARNERSKSAQYVSRDVIGYEDLDDNGDWVSEPEYGYVWRPYFVSATWAPYRYGRWVYVSPWGWSWVDDARWGFAPFHYGRWAYLHSRWCWVPGPRHIRPVYAPALVGWVGGPSVGISVSFGNVGWYPLGPRDPFYPGYRYTPHYIRYVNVSNTYFITNNYFYGRRITPPRFDYRHYPGAVTSVSRDHFVGGRRIGDHWVRIDDNHLRNYHAERRPPAIAPYRESVLGGAIRRPPRDADRFNWRHGGDYVDNRLPFHRERSAIENNGGRPIDRNELVDRNGPKRGGDFRSTRPGGSVDIKRPERDQALGLSGNDRRPRELNNDSVREWQSRRGSDDRSDNVSRPGRALSLPSNSSQSRDRDRQREPVEIMRGEPNRNDHMQRPPSSNSLQQQGGTSSFSRPPSNDRYRDREPSRSTGTGSLGRSEPRSYTPPPARSQPRQYAQPRSAPQPRFTPAPRSEPRSASPPPRSSPSPSNSNRGNGGGNRSAARPGGMTREN